MRKLQLEPGEQVIRDDPATWLRSWWRRPGGWLCLTTRRLVFELDLATSGHAGIVGFNDMRNRFPVEIPRDALDGVERGQQGRRHDLVVVRTEAESFRFSTSAPYAEWESTLRAEIASDRAALSRMVRSLEQGRGPSPDDPYRGGGPSRKKK